MMLWGDRCAVALRAAGLVLAGVVLASCGGGEQVQKFQPTRLIAFGDETSVIENVGDADDPSAKNGRKYSVNYKATATTARDCKLLPIWIQPLATLYGVVFPQCNPDSATPATGLILAQPNTGSAAVQTQIDAFLATAGNSFSGKDLVTVLSGQNDVLAQYALVKAGTTTDAGAIAAVEAAGAALAAQVNRVGQAGGKVLISTLPDMGLTPFAISEGTANAALLTRLTARFNSKLRIGLLNDGRMIGLLLLDEAVQAIARSAAVNSTDSPCAVAVPACNTQALATVTTTTMVTLPTPDTVTNWLWADAKHLGPYGHTTLGSLAQSRAAGNPF